MEYIDKKPRVEIHKRDRKDNGTVEPCVRLYCSIYREAWHLQIFGNLGIGPFGLRKGKDEVISTARMGREELTKLRDALDLALAEGEAC